jgi:hypothetical protein
MTGPRVRYIFSLAFAMCFILLYPAMGQGDATAKRSLQLSVFGGANGTFTGLQSGKNLGLVVGGGLSFLSYHQWRPSIEIRGKFAVHEGTTDSQKNVVGGLRLEHKIWIGRVYVDALVGRGELHYVQGLLTPDGNSYYTYSSSNIFSPGAGGIIDLTPHIGIFADVQLERYSVPVPAGSHIWSKSLTTGVSCRF